jgi:hypothetical protein
MDLEENEKIVDVALLPYQEDQDDVEAGPSEE